MNDGKRLSRGGLLSRALGADNVPSVSDFPTSKPAPLNSKGAAPWLTLHSSFRSALVLSVAAEEKICSPPAEALAVLEKGARGEEQTGSGENEEEGGGLGSCGCRTAEDVEGKGTGGIGDDV